MPPSRFAQVSRWRNLEATPSKSGIGRYEELPLSAQPDNLGSTLLLSSPSAPGYIFVRSAASPKSLLVVDTSITGKLGRRSPSLMVAPALASALADWDVAPWSEREGGVLLGAGGTDGSVVVRQLKLNAEEPQAEVVASIAAPAGGGASKPVVAVKFHPTSADVLLVATSTSLKVWDITKRGEQCSLIVELDAPAKIVDARWSLDGKFIAVAGTQGTSSVVVLYEPRAGAAPIASSPSHASASKPTRLTFLSPTSPALLTTGFDANATRQWSLFDIRTLSSGPVAQVSLDVGSSVLEPLADVDRGLVYLSSRTSSTLHWLDFGTSSTDVKPPAASGAFQLATPSGGAIALAPVSTLDVMAGQIARMLVASAPGAGPGNDQITPVTVTIPRRQYIDFHADLYPDTRAFAKPAQSASEWREGGNKALRLVSLDPARREEGEVEVEEKKEVQQVMETKSAQHASAPVSAPAHVVKAQTTPVAAATPAAVAPASAPAQAPSTATSNLPAPTRASSTTTTTTTTTSAAAASKPSTQPTQRSTARAPPNAAVPRWSRRFLTGHTPLLASYQNLTSLDVSRAPDARLLSVSPSLFVLPLAGPGGRLALHAVGKEGRLPAPLPSLQCGATLLDFTLDRFVERRVVTASEDCVVRIWDVPLPAPTTAEAEEGLKSVEKASKVIHVGGAGRLGELAPHPSAKSLMALAPADAEGQLHLLDLDDGGEKSARSMSVPGAGVFSLAWSPNGRWLVLAGKDKELRIVDPRKEAEVLAQAPAHTSSRSYRAIWLSDACLASVGHGAGSTRELLIFTFDAAAGKLTKAASQALDVSPAVLFPHWDADTGLLWLWSKGERSIAAFEIILNSQGVPVSKDAIQALPAFQHAQPQLGLCFGRKVDVDVTKVEVASCLRLSRGELQRVSWRIPRARTELFQDDVFVPTLAEEPRVDAKRWLEGDDGAEPRFVDLCPQGMELLSTAAAPRSKSTLPKGPIAREETETERSEKFLSSVFAKAKLDDSEAQVGAAARRAPDDDDWGSD